MGIIRTGLLLLMLASAGTTPADGADPGCRAGIKLQDHGPNTVSIRQDRTDDEETESYIDFVIAQKFPAWHDGCPPAEGTPIRFAPRLYFAFTGQFGFYALGTRYSSPVIGKRYLPKVFVRQWLSSRGDYIDFGYAHESNGQSIDTEASFLQRQADLIAQGENPNHARDYLSRGWDYLEFVGKHRITKGQLLGRNTVYVQLKYFLPDGLFQGKPEEYYPWETDNGKPRAEVDGISILFKTSGIGKEWPRGTKFALQYTTGYQQVFRNNTWRVELSRRIADFPPFFLWFQKGYNADLVDYYRNTSSLGLGLEMRNFLDDY